MSVASLNRVGALLSDPTRSAILVALMDGRAWTVTELAQHVRVAVSTASEHLSRLQDAHFVAVEAQGRHRYFRLSGVKVAELLETLGGVELPGVMQQRPAVNAAPTLRYARSCYDHLAGQLGVKIYRHLLDAGHLHPDRDRLSISPSGRGLFAALGLDLSALGRSRRPLVRTCVDWTERRHHLAGGLGAALFQLLIDQHWIDRGRRPRALVVTEAGRCGLERLTGGPLP